MTTATSFLTAETRLGVLPTHSTHEQLDDYGWSFELLPLIGLAVITLGYAALVVAARRRGRPVATGRILLFAAGLATIAVALFSPIDP